MTSMSTWIRRKEKYLRSWEKLIFNINILHETVNRHDSILKMADYSLKNRFMYEDINACLNSTDPIVRQGWELKLLLEKQFKDKLASDKSERILIQVPAPDYSPAGYSIFTNLAESLSFIGISTDIIHWDSDINEKLDSFRPTTLLSSDHVGYLSRIDWSAVRDYKRNSKLKVGLTASLAEYENTPLKERLDWAIKNDVNFYYSFRDSGYVTSREEYKPFFDAGFQIIYLPFGANILHYYPVSGIERDLNYALLASRKSEHMSYLKNLVRYRSGFIDGPGWRHVKSFNFNRDRDRYIYARALVGLNIHLPEQIKWACELNERTYQLAACGVPQLIDHPKLLDKIFSTNAMYVADTPQQYFELFMEIIANPDSARVKALLAQKELFQNHTTFHRSHDFFIQLKSL